MIVSRYSVIWAKLKKDKQVELAAPPKFHLRLKKAIIKRKDIDLGYKLLLAEEHKRAILEFSSKDSKLTVTLSIKTRSDYL